MFFLPAFHSPVPSPSLTPPLRLFQHLSSWWLSLFCEYMFIKKTVCLHLGSYACMCCCVLVCVCAFLCVPVSIHLCVLPCACVCTFLYVPVSICLYVLLCA